jgi:putative flippase GtrA
MRRVHNKIRKTIFSILDVFYPLFKRFMPLQTYHYAACGGSNTLLSFLIYSFTLNFFIKKQVVDLGFIALKPHNAALFIAFLVTFPVGFYLSMYVIFQGSYLKRKVQFARYFIVIMGCMLINYIVLQIFVEGFRWNATWAQIPTTAVVILFNYFAQRHFSFRSPRVQKTAGEAVNNSP